MSRNLGLTALICLISLVALMPAQNRDVHDGANNVSLIRLIANPKLFDGHRLRIAGYLDHNGLDKAVGIYVTESDGRNFILSNSIDLHLDESTVERTVGKYVILEGTYHAPTGPLASYTNGYFDRVSGIRSWTAGDISK